MKILAFLFFLSFSTQALANPSHPDLRDFPRILGAEIYAGFGLARDMINHVYKGQPFQPRDYDLAVVGSTLNEKEAVKILSEHGTIIKTLDMYREEIKPNGNVFSYHYGFVVIIESEGVQIDFKFFNTVEDAHTRGLFDVEKVLIPLENRTLDTVVADLKEHKNSGAAFTYSDPHKGFESILAKSPKTINWAKAKASGLDWIIRGAMINAKIGASDFQESEKPLMIERLKQVQYLRASDAALIKRAIEHKRSWKVLELLEGLNFFSYFNKWQGRKQAGEMVEKWRSSIQHFSCKKLI